MTLEGLAAAESRIAQIRSMFDGPSSTRGTSGATAQQLLPTAGNGNDALNTQFNDLLQEVKDASIGRTSAATNFLPKVATGTGTGRGARYEQFATDVLRGVGAPTTSENITAIKAWALAEGTKALNNPLATTRRAPNTTDFNSVGVKNYATYPEGVAATVATLKNGYYGNILAALANGNDPMSVAQAVANSKWGTGNGVTRVLQSGDY